MKKLLILALVGCMLMGLAACGEAAAPQGTVGGNVSNGGTNETTAPAAPIMIAAHGGT